MRWVCVFGLVIASSLPAQQFETPGSLPPMSEWPKPIADHFAVAGDALVSALKARAAPLKRFAMPELNTGWDWSVLKLSDNDTFIFSYTPPARFTFYVQAIPCGNHFLDSTILGPTETAAEFYDANVNFLASWDLKDLNCAEDALFGEISQLNTDIPNTKYRTSSDRAIRLLCFWLRFFSWRQKDPRRAADFLVTALDKHKAHLLDLESEKKLSQIVDTFDLFDKQFPKDGFDLGLPLDAEGRAHVCSYLETAVRIRGKLKPFIPNADAQIRAAARIKQDEALLAKFR